MGKAGFRVTAPTPCLSLYFSKQNLKTAVVNPRANLDPIHLGASELEFCTEKGILCEYQGSGSLRQCSSSVFFPFSFQFLPILFPLRLTSMTLSLYPHLPLHSLLPCLPLSLASLFLYTVRFSIHFSAPFLHPFISLLSPYIFSLLSHDLSSSRCLLNRPSLVTLCCCDNRSTS